MKDMTYLFVSALAAEMPDVLQQTVPLCCMELVNADQGVKEISWALG